MNPSTAAASSPVTAAKRGTHLALQGAPDPLQTCAHPWLAIPEHPPLPHISWVRLEMQDPGDAATRERPVERLAMVFMPRKGDIEAKVAGRWAQPSLPASIALSRRCWTVGSHAQMLGKYR